MNSAASLVLSCIAGSVLGVIFFAGLWWTVRRGMSSNRPALLFLFSLLVRTAIVLLGFYFVAGGDWKRLLASLGGFLIARMFATRVVRAPVMKSGEEVSHAP